MLRIAVVSFVVAACGAKAAPPPPVATAMVAPAATPPPVAPPAPPAPPALRLPTTVHPLDNVVQLTVDPTRDDITGTIATRIRLDEPTAVIWLNGEDLTIDLAYVRSPAGTVRATVLEPKPGYVGLVFPTPLAAGEDVLEISYTAKAHVNAGDGIFRYQENRDWYVATHFEATEGRRAFPTFDEPSFKVPWQLVLHIPSSLTAVSNAPVTSDVDAGTGTRTIVFAQTAPLPSYLVAFAVGPWELVDAGKTKDGIPVRVVVPRGRGADAAYPAKVSTELVDRLEDYFGTAFPFPKLDLVAVAVLNPGAEENAGMITFREPILLIAPAELTDNRRQSYADTAAHEIAHQWFGDLVTMAWWDDLWLNESFASWMQSKIVDAWKPEWGLGVDAVATKSAVMGQDSLDSARAIRQPIREHGDIRGAFDGITYAKGAAVLTMIERTVGADRFRGGVRAYLAGHARGNATYDDFVDAMSTAAGTDLHPLFDSFVKQSGIPYVSVALTCSAGAPPKLALAQQRYAPIGSKMADVDRHRTWSVPMCVKWRAGDATGTDCAVLDRPTGELALSAKACPAWLLPNAGELGYYRARLGGADLDHLLAHAGELTVAERVGVAGDVAAVVGAGDASTAVELGLVADLARAADRQLVEASFDIVAGIDAIVPDDQRGAYERWIGKLYGARIRALGWAARPGEPADTKRLRPTLLWLAGGLGNDRAIAAEATRRARAWLADRGALQPEVVDVTLRTAARNGDQALFDQLHAAASAATDKAERDRLVRALGAFRDPAIVDQALAVVLTEEFDIRVALGIVFEAMSDRALRPRVYAWFVAHFDDLLHRLPRRFQQQLARVPIQFCDEAHKPDIVAFLTPRMQSLDNGPRQLAQSMEALSLCAAQHAAQQPGVVAFLRKQ
jgi:alanyl aminopeptidase